MTQLDDAQTQVERKNHELVTKLKFNMKKLPKIEDNMDPERTKEVYEM